MLPRAVSLPGQKLIYCFFVLHKLLLINAAKNIFGGTLTLNFEIISCLRFLAHCKYCCNIVLTNYNLIHQCYLTKPEKRKANFEAQAPSHLQRACPDFYLEAGGEIKSKVKQHNLKTTNLPV